jgi:hypothetical protein
MGYLIFTLALLIGVFLIKAVWITIDIARVQRVVEDRGAVVEKIRVTPFGERELDERFMRLYSVRYTELDGSRFSSVYACPVRLAAYVIREECLAPPDTDLDESAAAALDAN